MMKSSLVAGFAMAMLFAGCDQMMHDAPKDATVDKSLPANQASSNEGHALFQANCAACHNPLKDATGPALQGSLARWNNDRTKLRSFIRNPAPFLKTDAYGKALFEKWKPTVMTGFPDLTDTQLEAIIDYCERPVSAVVATQ